MCSALLRFCPICLYDFLFSVKLGELGFYFSKSIVIFFPQCCAMMQLFINSIGAATS